MPARPAGKRKTQNVARVGSNEGKVMECVFFVVMYQRKEVE